jgi:hypothetical protein
MDLGCLAGANRCNSTILSAKKAVQLICNQVFSYSMQSSRVLILSGQFKGEEGICLGEEKNDRWAVSPDGSDEIVSLVRDREFALLVDLSGEALRN